jgi:hypothetical protein
VDRGFIAIHNSGRSPTFASTMISHRVISNFAHTSALGNAIAIRTIKCKIEMAAIEVVGGHLYLSDH